MTIAAPCGECHGCRDCSICHARTVLRWRGDYDFTDNRDIRNFQNYHHSLLDWQEGPTSLVWRIRYDPGNLDWFNLLRNAGAGWQYLGSTSELVDDYLHLSDGELHSTWYATADVGFGLIRWPVVSMGPVRDGIMYAAGMGEFNWHLEPFGGDVYGTRLRQHTSSGSIAGAAFGIGEFYKGGPESVWYARGQALIVGSPIELGYVDVPFALDIGCVRCVRGETVITWPPSLRRRLVRNYYVGDTPPFLIEPAWYHSAVPGNEWEITRIPHECEALENPVVHAHYWAGDIETPVVSAPCPADVIVWTHPGARWPDRVPLQEGAALPPVLYGRRFWEKYRLNATAGHRVGWWRGWATDGAQGLAHADLTGVRGIILDGDVFGGLTTSNGLPDAIGVLVDWLSEGGKVLAIPAPYCCTASTMVWQENVPPFGLDGVVGEFTPGDGGLLAALGLSMQLSSSRPWSDLYINYPTHRLAATPTHAIIGAGVSVHYPENGLGLAGGRYRAVLGGTEVERTTLQVADESTFVDLAEWVSCAYEVLGSGSVVMVHTTQLMTLFDDDRGQMPAKYFWNLLGMYP